MHPTARYRLAKYTPDHYRGGVSPDQVTIGARWWHSSRAKAEAKLVYQSGQQVTVYYNPDNPAQAVLEAGTTRGVWGTLIIGVVLTFFGAIVLVINATGMLAR